MNPTAVSSPLVVWLRSLGRDATDVAGGKGANLGELMRAGLPVPDGFCVTTLAYRRAAADAGIGEEVERLARADSDEARSDLARRIRDRLRAVEVSIEVVSAVTEAYRTLANGDEVKVAVRSSGTAEDLGEASFAGQLETYLNVSAGREVIESVRRCWASLWTDRAVAYRAANEVEQRDVATAVVVQRMVDATVAGVLFTADPVTGRRSRAVIDAAHGLGDAVVSGSINPDHFAVDTAKGTVEERSVRGAGTLNDAELRALALLGRRVEAHYGEPQDIEFALDAGRRIWLTQARPITSLYPLPGGAPGPPELRLYFSANVAQGFLSPFTPMGLQTMRLIGTGIATLIGRPPGDPLAGPDFLAIAGQRLFFDVTPIVRDPLGRRLFLGATSQMEARTNAAVSALLQTERRLAVARTSGWRSALTVLRWLAHARIPPRVIYALLAPASARQRAARTTSRALRWANVSGDATPQERISAFEQLIRNGVPEVVPNVLPLVAAGAAAYALATRLLGDLASNEERQVIRRALPNNPTMEMDLALWELSRRVRGDVDARAVLDRPAADLARLHHERALPPAFQVPLEEFLARYGFRTVGEIDLGVPRWSDDPTHLLAILASYAQQPDDASAPDMQFRRAREEAESMVRELSERAARRGRVRGVLARIALRKTRALFGMREVPKASMVRLLGRARALMRSVGVELATTGAIDEPEDVFFLTIADLRRAAEGTEFRPLVRERRASYRRELRRRHVPRLLLSDGTEPAAPEAADEPLLRGTAASPGMVTAQARVVLRPGGAHVRPGEILVAPSTDPGWTPLFLVAGGLVMEMGGAMSHGAIVAREYGIPAVVGVPDATTRIATGDRITVDGSAGVVRLANAGVPASSGTMPTANPPTMPAADA